MSKIVKLAMAASLICLVSGCKQQNYSYSYLLQHTTVLESEYNRCQALPSKSPEQVTQCKVVDNAVKAVTDIIAEQRNDPEKFGLRILIAQMAMQDLHNNVTTAEAALADLKKKSATEADLKTAQSKVSGAILAYNAKQEEVKMLLSIMGVNTPE